MLALRRRHFNPFGASTLAVRLELEHSSRMQTLRLFGTPLSHFTRKVRIVLAELGVEFEYVRTSSVLAPTSAGYGDNPLLRIPTLVHGGETIIDSDHIARYLVARYDPADRLRVNSLEVESLNRLAVVTGIMNNEVVLLLAKRAGLADLEAVAYFRKLRSAIDGSLDWLERRLDPGATDFGYADVALVCMWQHLLHYGLVAEPERYATLTAVVNRAMERPSVATTTPARSLEDATAAGWKAT